MTLRSQKNQSILVFMLKESLLISFSISLSLFTVNILTLLPIHWVYIAQILTKPHRPANIFRGQYVAFALSESVML